VRAVHFTPLFAAFLNLNTPTISLRRAAWLESSSLAEALSSEVAAFACTTWDIERSLIILFDPERLLVGCCGDIVTDLLLFDMLNNSIKRRLYRLHFCSCLYFNTWSFH
jgi:hypothetical protein